MSAAKYEKGTTDEVNVKMMPDSDRPNRPPESEVQKYRTTRLVLVGVFLIILIAMTVAAVIIIATAERCEKAEKGDEPTEEKKTWWDDSVAYQIYLPSFDDGKLSDVHGRISKFESRSISVLSLSPIVDLKDFMKVKSEFGTMDDFETLVKKLHDEKMKLVLDFDPSYTSDTHPWFVASQNATAKQADYYIWKENNTLTNSPWKNETSSWVYVSGRNQSYLLSSSGQPQLNYGNADVKAAIKKVIKFWLSKNVDGIKLNGVDELLVDFDNKKRRDLPGVHPILQEWRKLFNITSKPIMIGQISSSSDINAYYGDDDNELNSVVTYLEINKDVTVLKATLEKIFGNQGNHTAAFAVDDLSHGRTTARLGEKFADAVNTLTLTLPGKPVWYYGQETGLSGSADEKLIWENDNNKVKNNYNKLMKMVMNEEDFKGNEMNIIKAENGFIAYKLGKHVVAIKFEGSVDHNELSEELKKSFATCVFDSRGVLTKGSGSINLHQFSLNNGQAIILKV